MKHSAQHAFHPEEVMAYLDGELEPRRAAALVEHLAHCEECQALAAQFRQLSERLLEFEVEPSPENIGNAVLGALENLELTKKDLRNTHAEKPRRWRIVWRSHYTWAFVCLLIVALIINERNAIREAMAPPTASKSTVAMTDASSTYMADYANQQERAAPGGGGEGDGEGGGKLQAPEVKGPMIAQTASLTIVAANFDEASTAIDHLAKAHGGYVQKLTAEAQSGAAREFSATLRVPANQLDSFLADLRKLGHVDEESRANEEVTDQYVDLAARLRSARATEQRMLQLLAMRTGKLEDVLAAEQELARIREEIESMDGQRVMLLHRVDYATVDVQLREQYVEHLHSGSPSRLTGVRNAFVEGLGNLEDGSMALLVFLLAYGPSILFWLAILALPAWLIWRRVRSRRLRRL